MNRELLKQQMIEWRQHFHSHPEAAFEEVETAKFIAERLREMGMEVVEGVGKTGVVGTLKVGDGERVIGLRADIDSLKMQEKTGLPYRSQTPGRMHSCGHDGHTATILGVAKALSESKDFNGTVRFIFQPAEEPGYGARAMLEDGFMERFPVDEIYSFHNSPSELFGEFNTNWHGVKAAEDNFTIKIKGLGGHASAPQMTKDPLVVGAEIIMALQTIVSRNVTPRDTAVVSCTEFECDGVHNSIPSNVEIRGDCRSFKPEISTLIETRMKAICEHICRMNNCELEFKYTHEFLPTINDPEIVAYAVNAAKKVFAEENIHTDYIRMASDDFAEFALRIPSCYFLVGSGLKDVQNTPIHNPHFDYNDDILIPTVDFFLELINQRLPK